MKGLELLALGQVGYQFSVDGFKWIIDPYLSNFVEEKFGKELKRQVGIILDPKKIFNLDLILITHDHEDHCDPLTLKQIVKINPNCKIYCPKKCNEIIVSVGISPSLIFNPESEKEYKEGPITIMPFPVAHPELEIEGNYSRWLSYIIKIENLIFFHAGDTVPVEFSYKFPTSIDIGFLPINERNYFREKAGIIGNMTCREALLWSKELNIMKWIPTHWDMFTGNLCSKDELELISNELEISNFEWLDAGSCKKYLV